MASACGEKRATSEFRDGIRWLNPADGLKRFLRRKKAPTISDQGFLFKILITTYSHMGSPTLPSAMALFTSEFGMGSGGSTPLWPSSKLLCAVRKFVYLSLLTILFWNSDNQGQTGSYSVSFVCLLCVLRPPWKEEVLEWSGTISSKTTLVLYGQASRAISIG